ncbi:hypothetical protein GDO81_014532 [Engystomops pustulosus]|uniref:C2 domain-containing protein n=1 Tax=Engystomops pustulosus TaxID=76066 RepID=A0AAV7BBB5_ENGPU|nr:hypothetical protein GDO81_014532 [Engystomops pustulosus]
MEGDDAGSPAMLPAASDLGFAALLLLFAASLLTVLAWLVQVTRGARPAQPGARGLLTALCSFPTIRESWSRAWAQALNREAVRSRSSVQMMFEENIILQPTVHISHVSCTQHSDSRMIEVRLQELQQAGLLVSWGFKERPDMLLHVIPKQSHQSREGGAELCTLQDLVQNVLLAAEPAMMFNLKAHDSNMGICDRLIQGSPTRTDSLKLLVRQLHLRDVVLQDPDVELICDAELDCPSQRKKTRTARIHRIGETWNVSWSEEMIFDLTPQSKELSLKVWQMVRSADNLLLGHTSVPLRSPEKDLCGKRLYPLTSGTTLAKIAAPSISVEFYIPEGNLPRATLGTPTQRINITPTKKVEMDRTVMPDGTIVTTVTTIQSRPKLDGKIESPARSPSKVEVTENKPVLLPRSCSSGSSPSGSGGSPSSIKLDPVAETAIRQLTEPGNKSSKRTPTKRSTLIISGVSKVPIGEDEMALSLGYAASMDASLHETSTSLQDSLTEDSTVFPSELAASHCQDDDTTRSDISDRPSLDDVDSETGSTGALETRSLKDHKVGFLRSGTKLFFRRHHRDTGLSQSHDDLTNSATASRKKSGSFPRRLFKRFSLKTKSKPSVNGSAGEK